MAGRAPKIQGIGRPGARVGRRPRRFGVVVARFNEEISKRLLDGALRAFRSHGCDPSQVEVHWVPGSFELPQAALHLALTGRFAAIV